MQKRKPGRPRLYTPEEAERRDRQQKKESWKRTHHAFNERRRAKRDRDCERERRLGGDRRGHRPSHEELSTVTTRELKSPSLLYIDGNGNIHTEKWETADALIERWLRAQARAKKLCKETTSLLAKATELLLAGDRKEKRA